MLQKIETNLLNLKFKKTMPTKEIESSLQKRSSRLDKRFNE